jgi:hypothetical protein
LDLENRCINLIPSTVAKLNLTPLGKAYAAHKIQIHCDSSAVNAIRDPFYKYLDSVVPRDSFEYFVGLHGNKTLAQNGTITPDESKISNQIIDDASQKCNQKHWIVEGINFIESPIDQLGNSISSINPTAGQLISRYPTTSPMLAGFGVETNVLQTLFFSGSRSARGFTTRAVGYPILGFCLPHLMSAGYPMIPSAVINYVGDTVHYGVDTIVAHPWISGGSALAFGLTGGYVYDALLLYANIVGVQSQAAATPALAAGAAVGTVAGLGVLGAGTLANAAVSSYQSDEGYIGGSVNRVTKAITGFGGWIRDLATPTNTTPISDITDMQAQQEAAGSRARNTSGRAKATTQ